MKGKFHPKHKKGCHIVTRVSFRMWNTKEDALLKCMIINVNPHQKFQRI